MLKRQAGFAHLAILMLAGLIVLIALGGWWVSSRHHAPATQQCVNLPIGAMSTNNECVHYYKAINSFADCQGQPGSKMIETYPEQCVDNSGHSWPNPAQQMCNGHDMVCQNNMTPPSGY